jgi:hypothetical protein
MNAQRKRIDINDMQNVCFSLELNLITLTSFLLALKYVTFRDAHFY